MKLTIVTDDWDMALYADGGHVSTVKYGDDAEAMVQFIAERATAITSTDTVMVPAGYFRNPAPQSLADVESVQQ